MHWLMALAFACAAWGATSTAWEMNNYADFIRGRFQGVSLTRDGRVTTGPRLDPVFAPDDPVVWTLAAAPDGTLYAGTGHQGRVYRVPRTGEASVIFAAPELEVFAIATDPQGAVYAATSPDGKVYKIENGKAREYFVPKTKYIWALAVGSDGTLYAGTGDGGKVFRVTSEGKGEVYYETGQSHVTSLALDSRGLLLAGTEPNGMLYRVTEKGKAFALYDASLPEIRAIAVQPDGTIYAAAMGGSVSKRSQAAQQSQAGAGSGSTPTVTTTITVTAEAAAQAGEIKPTDPSKPQSQTATATPPVVTSQFTPVVEMSGVEKSALYRINPDNTVETLWSSKEENAYDLTVRGGQIWFSTDVSGRVYRLDADRKATLLTQTNQGEATRLVADGRGLLVATAHLGRILRIEDRAAASGTYESPVHDAGSVARWGRLGWRADGTGLTFRTRSGNALRPDATWSEWSEALSSPGALKSPNARYVQWKVEFTGTPVLDSVTLAYLPQNNPPVIRGITVMNTLSATSAAGAKPAAAAITAYSVTVTDGGDATPASAGTPTQMTPRSAATQTLISWQAEDPDGDRLVYELHFRGEGEREWKLVKGDLHETNFSIESDALADGRYVFRVTASDREANAAPSAREAALESGPVLIDNTPPLVTARAIRRSGAAVEFDVDASDAASPLRRCEVSVDGGAWRPLTAADGVIDSERESFSVKLDGVAAGEHLVVVRVVDAAGNAGLAKVLLR